MSNHRPRRTKRLAAATTALSLMFSLVVVGVVGNAVNANAAYTTACSGATDTHFSDHPGTAANCLFDYNLAKGKVDGTFGEDDVLKRSQFASFVTRFLDAAGVAHTARTTFPDVNSSTVPDATVLQEIEEGHAAGVVTGYSAQSGDVVNGADCGGSPCVAGDFGPNNDMSVAQACTIILNMMDVIHAANAAAPAGNATGDPSTDYDACVANGIIDLTAKDAGGTTYPNLKTDKIMRGLFADMLAQVIQKEVDAGVVANVYTASNESFGLTTPADTQLLQFNDGSNYHFTGLDDTKQYDVTLLPCATFESGSTVFSNNEPVIDRTGHTNTDGQISFRDVDGGTGNQPDDIPDRFNQTQENNAQINLINLNNQGATLPSSYANNIAPKADGTMDVLLSSTGVDCAIPLVYLDKNGDNTINLKDKDEDTAETDNTPVSTEPFRIGPASVWYDGQGANGNNPADFEIVFRGSASKFPELSGQHDDLGVVLDDDFLYGLSTADSFFYDGSEANGPISDTNAMNWVSPGDDFGLCDGSNFCNTITNSYSRTGANNFGIWADEAAYAKVQGVSVNLGDFNNSGTGDDDARISWNAEMWDGAPSADADQYCWEVWDVNNMDGGSVDNNCTDEVDSLDQTGDAPLTTAQGPGTADDVDAFDLASGTYVARVYVDSEDDEGDTWSDWSSEFTVDVGVPGAPISGSAVHTDKTSNATVDDGDTLDAIFNEAMAAPANGDEVDVLDADCTIGSLIAGTNATFVLTTTNVPNDTLAIVVGATGPIISSPGGNSVLDFTAPAAIGACGPAGPARAKPAGQGGPVVINSSGNTDSDESLEWDLTAGDIWY